MKKKIIFINTLIISKEDLTGENINVNNCLKQIKLLIEYMKIRKFKWINYRIIDYIIFVLKYMKLFIKQIIMILFFY